MPVVVTIHNLAFQGVFPPHLLGVIGLGLAAYGLYCGVNARYRRFEGNQ